MPTKRPHRWEKQIARSWRWTASAAHCGGCATTKIQPEAYYESYPLIKRHPTRACNFDNTTSNDCFPNSNVLASICCNTTLSPHYPLPCWPAGLAPLTSSLGPPGCSRCQWRCCGGSWRAQTFSWSGSFQEWLMTDSRGVGKGKSDTHNGDSITISQTTAYIVLYIDTYLHVIIRCEGIIWDMLHSLIRALMSNLKKVPSSF